MPSVFMQNGLRWERLHAFTPRSSFGLISPQCRVWPVIPCIKVS
uniref:Uncharacterized protein n=1 Tax=Anguilla anguilla TaxID=7936 RepID=A0A0E9W2R1_ANGAN